MAKEQLPEGFRFADDLPVGAIQKWIPLPPEAYEKPRRRRRTPSEDEIKVHSLWEALRLFRIRMSAASKIHDVNFQGARIGTLFINTPTQDRYLVMFKRSFYLRFSQHFPQVPEKGYGIIAAKKLVAWAAQEDVIIAAIFPSGRCYTMKGFDFWLYYEQYKTDAAHLEGEIAAPLSLFRKLF